MMRLFAIPRNDFGFVVLPKTVTVHAGRNGHYTITVSRGSDFTAPIGFDVRGLPRHVSAGLTPYGTGYDPHRTVIIDAGRHARAGSHRLKIVARGGNRAHHHYVTLKITRH